MNDTSLQSAALFFTSASVLVGITMLLLKEAGSRLIYVLRAFPPSERWEYTFTRIKAKKNHNVIVEALGSGILGIIALSVSMFCQVFVLYGAGSVIIGFRQDSFPSDVIFFRVMGTTAIITFMGGIVAVGLAFLVHWIAFIKGRPNWFETEEYVKRHMEHLK